MYVRAYVYIHAYVCMHMRVALDGVSDVEGPLSSRLILALNYGSPWAGVYIYIYMCVWRLKFMYVYTLI